MPGNKDEEKTHYWSLRDIPKFEGKGEQPFSQEELNKRTVKEQQDQEQGTKESRDW